MSGLHRTLRIATLLEQGRPGIASRHAPARPGAPAVPLTIGRATGALFGIADDWLATNTPAVAPYGSQVHMIDDARVHSSSGIVVLPTGEIVEDTLDHTAEHADGYRRVPDGRIVFEPYRERVLRGRHLSLLLGACDNHFHMLLMNLARLAILDAAETRDLAGVLVPDDLGAVAHEALRLAGVATLAPPVPVRGRERLRVETLVLPWNVASGVGVNPDAAQFLHGLGAPATGPARRRIYVDRSGAARRRLVNEDEVVAALAGLGVEPVRFEHMTLAAQIATMREAALVIGPHGAGLANIVFAPASTRIVELRPPTGVNWCYRYLAASRGQLYDCVFGKRVADGDEDWMVSPAHAASAMGL